MQSDERRYRPRPARPVPGRSSPACASPASRLATGSSASRTLGSCASARAMATRCRSPPESRSGPWRSAPIRETDTVETAEGDLTVAAAEEVEQRRDAAAVAQPSGEHVLEHAQAGDNVVILPDEADPAAQVHELGATTMRLTSYPVEVDGTGRDGLQAVDGAQESWSCPRPIGQSGRRFRPARRAGSRVGPLRTRWGRRRERHECRACGLTTARRGREHLRG